MEEKRGLFLVFDGPDGSGKLTQARLLQSHIQELSKYNDVLMTHEPWKSEEIKRKLAQDKDAYSDGARMAELYVEDRVRHTSQLLRPALRAGAIILADRYTMSTCAYQWAQGVKYHRLIEMHENKGILIPDITFFLNISLETARERVNKRAEQSTSSSDLLTAQKLEKFEKDKKFVDKLIHAYRSLAHMAEVDESIFGKVITIKADRKPEEISEDIKKIFAPVYSGWKGQAVK